MRDFQDAFLHGPPPLGPGAPARERLEAFVVELVQRQADHLEFALAAEALRGRALAPAYGPLLLHVAALVREIAPTVDERIIAGPRPERHRAPGAQPDAHAVTGGDLCVRLSPCFAD